MSQSPHISPQTTSCSEPSHFSSKTEHCPSQLNSHFLHLWVSGSCVICLHVHNLTVLELQPQALIHPPNPSSPCLVQLQLWTPQITKTRPLLSVTPVSSMNNCSIPPFNPRGRPSKISQLNMLPAAFNQVTSTSYNMHTSNPSNLWAFGSQSSPAVPHSMSVKYEKETHNHWLAPPPHHLTQWTGQQPIFQQASGLTYVSDSEVEDQSQSQFVFLDHSI